VEKSSKSEKKTVKKRDSPLSDRGLPLLTSWRTISTGTKAAKERSELLIRFTACCNWKISPIIDLGG
jgi:hypothetical protein